MFATLCFLLAACPSESTDSGSADTSAELTPTVEIGGGELQWEALAEGDEHIMVHGPQGGWHMLGSVRATGFDEVLSVHFWITASEHDDAVVSDNTYRVIALVDEDDPTVVTYPGLYGYLDVSGIAEGEADTPPELLSYQQVVLHMEVSDEAGHSASDSLAVIAAPDPADIDKVPTAYSWMTR